MKIKNKINPNSRGEEEIEYSLFARTLTYENERINDKELKLQWLNESRLNPARVTETLRGLRIYGVGMLTSP